MSARPPLAEIVLDRVVVLDGGLATEMEDQGHDLGSRLWSARLLADHPRDIEAAHARYFAAGAEVATTASYQASYEGFASLGLDPARTDELLIRSVQLAQDAAATATSEDGRPRWVAASVGPYGAMLANGEEYTGDYGADVGVQELRAWHRRRLHVLASAGPDVLALETVPNLHEAEALLLEVDALGFPSWLAMSCTGTTTRRHEPVQEAYSMAASVDAVVAVGVNCTDPRDVHELIRLATASSGKPAVAYPNSGESWDGIGRRWVGDPQFSTSEVAGWIGAGARLIGGCCRVGPQELQRLARTIRVRAEVEPDCRDAS